MDGAASLVDVHFGTGFCAVSFGEIDCELRISGLLFREAVIVMDFGEKGPKDGSYGRYMTTEAGCLVCFSSVIVFDSMNFLQDTVS